MVENEQVNYYDFFLKLSALGLEEAEELDQLSNTFDPVKVKELVKKNERNEKMALAICQDVLVRLDKDLFPPIFREDILGILHALDRYVYAIRVTGESFYKFHIREMIAEGADLSKVLYEMSKEIHALFLEFFTLKKSIEDMEHFQEFHKLFARGMSIERETLHNLTSFTKQYEDRHVLSWVMICETFQEAFQRAKDLIFQVESMIIKNR